MSDSAFKPGRWVAAALALGALTCAFLLLLKDNMPKGEVRTVDGYVPWNEKTLAIAETLPVQDGGRIKPLSTYAGFNMLGLHGARSMKIRGSDGNTYKLTPTAWLMDSLFRPNLAVKLPTFRIENSDVLKAIDVKPREKRDRYSYEDLVPGLQKLGELAQSYERIEKEKRDPVQLQTIDLSQNVRAYESLIAHFAYARNGVLLQESMVATQPTRRAEISGVMEIAGELRSQIENARSAGQPLHPHLVNLMEQIEELSHYANAAPRLFPPAGTGQPTWQTSGELISSVVSGQSKTPQQAVQDIRSMEQAVRTLPGDEAAFAVQIKKVHDTLVQRATSRGEYKHVMLEARYYRMNWFLYALFLYIAGTVTALAMWAAGRGITGLILAITTLILTLGGLGLSVIAIVQRCIIMERPPVGNLYDTIIFICAAVVFFALIVELMVSRRLALGLAPMLGTALILLARLFEVGDANDNMDPLIAVLASNFWLATHVITISLGYASGLLAAFLSAVYILMRGLNLDDGDRDLRRALTRATYGILCLTLFLSLVGTVLGGIWANYSWGRFWGWDPKENGALLIVLWTLAILHARLGGYLREWSLHFASLFTACVVTFSWWHVNFFNTGLHNYGFTTGKTTIWAFYGTVTGLLAFGVIAMVVEMVNADSRKTQPPHLPND